MRLNSAELHAAKREAIDEADRLLPPFNVAGDRAVLAAQEAVLRVRAAVADAGKTEHAAAAEVEAVREELRAAVAAGQATTALWRRLETSERATREAGLRRELIHDALIAAEAKLGEAELVALHERLPAAAKARRVAEAHQKTTYLQYLRAQAAAGAVTYRASLLEARADRARRAVERAHQPQVAP